MMEYDVEWKCPVCKKVIRRYWNPLSGKIPACCDNPMGLIPGKVKNEKGRKKTHKTKARR